MNKLNTGIIILAIILIPVTVWHYTNQPQASQEINSFKECTEAGYPVMESFPRKCAVPGGRTFESEEDRKQFEDQLRQ